MTESIYSDSRVREWARRNGHNVGERGRLPITIHEAFKAEYPAHIVPGENPNGTCSVCFQTTCPAWCDNYVPTPPPSPPVVVADFPAESSQEASLPTVEASESTPALSDATAALTAALAALTTSHAPALDVEAVKAIVDDRVIEAVSELTQPKRYEINVAGLPTKVIDSAVHAKFEDVTRIVGAGLHVYLVGPPGTGKTTLCGQVADALSLPFAMIPCDPTMPASKLFGFIDATGTYRDTVFRRCYEDGGLFLFDELDNAHPGIIASINGAIANGHCAFPDGMVKRSANFRCAAAANTFGTGATRQFVGRNQLDAATLDRFVTVVLDVDETLEETLTLAAIPENVQLGREWLAKVREWRTNAAAKSLQVIISPRAAIEGARLLGLGFSMADTAEMKVWKGMDASTRSKVEGGF